MAFYKHVRASTNGLGRHRRLTHWLTVARRPSSVYYL